MNKQQTQALTASLQTSIQSMARIDTLEDATTALTTAIRLNKLSNSLVVYVLGKVHDKELYKECGLKSTSAFAEKILNLSRSTASEFVKISKYYVNPVASIFADNGQDFSTSVLIECERQNLTKEEIQELPRNITVKELRKRKKTIEAEPGEVKDNSTEVQEKEAPKHEDIFRLTLTVRNGKTINEVSTEVSRETLAKTIVSWNTDNMTTVAKWSAELVQVFTIEINGKEFTQIYQEYERQ